MITQNKNDFRANGILKVLGLALLFTFGNCTSLNTSIVIKSTPQKVMAEIKDFEKYPEWNPFILNAKGNPKLDSELQVKIKPLNKDPMDFEPTVILDDANHFAWRGRVIMPGIFSGEHHFEVNQIDSQTVTFKHYEHFNGILIPFFSLDSSKAGFIKMNEALKKRLENKNN